MNDKPFNEAHGLRAIDLGNRLMRLDRAGLLMLSATLYEITTPDQIDVIEDFVGQVESALDVYYSVEGIPGLARTMQAIGKVKRQL